MGTAFIMLICAILAFVSFFAGIMYGHDIIGCIAALFFCYLAVKVFNAAPEEFRKQVCELQKREELKKSQGGFKCPSCGMMAGHKMSSFSNRPCKIYKCENCKYMW